MFLVQQLAPSTLWPYGLFCLSVILLWIPSNYKLWAGPLIGALAVGVLGGFISSLGIFQLFTIGLLLYYRNASPSFLVRLLFFLSIAILGMALSLHWMPGFHNPQLLRNVYFSPDALPFSLYLNFDKTAVGILILGLTHSLISRKEEWRPMIKKTLPWAAVVIALMMGISLLIHFVRFEPKVPSTFLLWAVTNLLFVCMAEEALYRGFIQKNLTFFFQNKRIGTGASLIIASLLFGLMHYTGGPVYVALCTIAGIGYGWIYHITKRIEASMFAHFLLNLIHFLFFTYPALKPLT